MEFGDKRVKITSGQQKHFEFDDNLSEVSGLDRRGFLRDTLGFGAAVFGTVTFGLSSDVSAESRSSSTTVNLRSLGISSRARTDVQKTADLAINLFAEAYGLDKRNPFELKDGVAKIKFSNDQLGIMPEEATIAAVMSPTKVGQLHSVMTAIYTALHCDGKDGICDENIVHQAHHGVNANRIVVLQHLLRAKNNIVHALKLNAGIFENQNEARNARSVLLDAQNQFNASCNSLMNYGAGRGRSGEYNKTLHYRVAKILELIPQYSPRINARDPESGLEAFHKMFNRIIGPEIGHRIVKFKLSNFLPNNVGVLVGSGDEWRNAHARLAASGKSLNLLFPEIPLPTCTTFIPYVNNAVPEFRLFYKDENKTYCVPIHVAYGKKDPIESRIPDIRTLHQRAFSFNENLPEGMDLANGLVKAFNLTVGISSSVVRSAGLDRRVDLDEMMRGLGITSFVGGPQRDTDTGILLTDSELYEPNISEPWDLGASRF